MEQDIHSPESIGVLVPGEGDFTGVEYLAEQDLTAFCSAVRKSHAPHLSSVQIQFLWKAKGGVSGGRHVLGKCVKASGLVKFFSNRDFVIWFAADHLRMMKPTRKQMMALVFHELSHIAATSEGWTTVGHDVEMFLAEVREFGFWKNDLLQASRAFQEQLVFDGLVIVKVAADGCGTEEGGSS